MDKANVVIVGGGLAGAAAAESYRKSGGAGSVMLVSADPDLPVHRPPLSKEYLRGDAALDSVFVQPETFYHDNHIELRLRSGVERIELTDKRIVLDDGATVAFDTLVLATGARPRRLSIPGGDLHGVHYLRSLKSAQRLRGEYADVDRAVIIGAGFIGMEVAATLTQRGVACTIVEMAPTIWTRLMPPVAAEFVQRHFQERGVQFRFGVGVQALAGDDHVRTVVLDDGTRLPADLVIAGVGALLNTRLGEDVGLEADRGIVVDEYLRTSHPDVYAIGDIASFPDPIAGRIHLEHWDNALNQGRTVGKTLAGDSTEFHHVAYFFSDLFDLSLNMIGYPEGWDDVIVRRRQTGEHIDEAPFTIVYGRNGVVRAALMVNDDEHFDTWTELIQSSAPIDRQLLADRERSPSELMQVASA